MAGNTVEITDGNFEEVVLNSDTLIVVDFWAEWCGPCKQIAPVLEELAAEHADTYKIGKLNVDESKENAMQYGIRSIPTMLVFKDGQVVE
ncbi:TPA: thioredoxin, partial [Candidatus Poribacteria bacterium]|nr:thioredoxin [Candidatus Poribacteria bacterium]